MRFAYPQRLILSIAGKTPEDKIYQTSMNRFLLIISGLLLQTYFVSAQNFKGQWKGSFLDKSSSFAGWGGDTCDYVLELEVNDKTVTGYSYTYFTDGGKKFYTICSLKGYINRGEKYIEVKEVTRTKTNVPVHIRNCFQVHRLTYFKKGDLESLEGKWQPAPNQEGDCGYGITSLERRVLKKNTQLYNNTVARNSVTHKKTSSPVKKQSVTVVQKKAAPPAAKISQRPNNNASLKPNKDVKEETVDMPVAKNNLQEKFMAPSRNFEKRNNTVLKTIEVENVSVKVSLYDNGEIDGDSVSLFYNGKLLLSRQRLSDKPICLNIKVENESDMNELVMYAENLGSIPPNTALMVVNDGNKRYEVRITSDLQKSGTIRFVLREPGK